MKKGNLPTQEYELINVCMQTVESGTPLTCDDCGRTIFNIATIKGKSDGKTYNVGLSCVKKLLNKSIYFDLETGWEFERKEKRMAKRTHRRNVIRQIAVIFRICQSVNGLTPFTRCKFRDTHKLIT